MAVFGTGWWSNFQIPAWNELGNLKIVALYNRTVSKAEAIRERFDLDCKIYSDAEELLENEQLDFMDIITETPFHKRLVLLGAKYKVPVVCQKPMAYTMEDCVEMREACRRADIPLIINENYRWQAPVRQIKKLIDEGLVGQPFRSQISLSNFGPFQLPDNQPFLMTLRHYVMFDLGVHAFDVARYLHGEPDRVYAQTLRSIDFLRGDDTCQAILTYKDCLCAVTLTDRVFDRIVIEGIKGTLRLTADYELTFTDRDGVVTDYPCKTWKRYDYVTKEDEAFLGEDVVDSIVQTQRDIVNELRFGTPAEATVDQYIKTMEITLGAIRSSLTGESTVLYRY